MRPGPLKPEYLVLPSDLVGKNIFISGYSRNHLFRIDSIDWNSGMYSCTDLLEDDPKLHPSYWSEYKIREGFGGDRRHFRTIRILSEAEVEEYRRNHVVRRIMED
jgi:hypothetical protein